MSGPNTEWGKETVAKLEAMTHELGKLTLEVGKMSDRLSKVEETISEARGGMRVLRWVVGAAASIIIVVFGRWLASEVVLHGQTLSAQGAALVYQKEQLSDLRKDLTNLMVSQKQIAAILEKSPPRQQVSFAGYPLVGVVKGGLIIDNLIGDKHHKLMTSSDVRVLINGKATSLEKLTPGLRVFLDFDKVGVVRRIDAYTWDIAPEMKQHDPK